MAPKLFEAYYGFRMRDPDGRALRMMYRRLNPNDERLIQHAFGVRDVSSAGPVVEEAESGVT